MVIVPSKISEGDLYKICVSPKEKWSGGKDVRFSYRSLV